MEIRRWTGIFFLHFLFVFVILIILISIIIDVVIYIMSIIVIVTIIILVILNIITIIVIIIGICYFLLLLLSLSFFLLFYVCIQSLASHCGYALYCEITYICSSFTYIQIHTVRIYDRLKAEISVCTHFLNFLE